MDKTWQYFKIIVDQNWICTILDNLYKTCIVNFIKSRKYLYYHKNIKIYFKKHYIKCANIVKPYKKDYFMQYYYFFLEPREYYVFDINMNTIYCNCDFCINKILNKENEIIIKMDKVNKFRIVSMIDVIKFIKLFNYNDVDIKYNFDIETGFIYVNKIKYSDANNYKIVIFLYYLYNNTNVSKRVNFYDFCYHLRNLLFINYNLYTNSYNEFNKIQ